MSFMDELRKLTQPYNDDDDFFEDSIQAPEVKAEKPVSTAQQQFENAFATEVTPVPEKAVKPQQEAAPSGGFLSSFAGKRSAKPAPRQKTVSFGGSETQVFLFNPKSFDEAGELVAHLQQGRSLVMTLEGVEAGNARRLLDFISGVTFALDGKITPVSAKTYFITPQNVDFVPAQGEAPASESQYF